MSYCIIHEECTEGRLAKVVFFLKFIRILKMTLRGRCRKSRHLLLILAGCLPCRFSL